MTIVSGALLWALLGLPVDKPASEPQNPTLLQARDVFRRFEGFHDISIGSCGQTKEP